ncbi:MAG: DUF4178 domain-containing protein [Alphaproteobacteria bacterium]|nr:DUF4178 domain-containing protein [Alphaproteobacteria bacterium]
MLSSTCPSCSAPLRFKHAASAAARCDACGSTVVRDGETLEAIGKVSAFARDLSPLQVGARGKAGDRPFEIAGVLRKEREAVRWSEWFIVFDDGATGWLAEGNGQLQLFGSAPVPLRGVSASEVKVGYEFEASGRIWTVIEADRAAVTAAEGELPFPVTATTALPYADLRSTDGRATGTLDFADSPPSLWVGRVVELADLKMTGLRPITGWSDPTLTDMAGPEVAGVRTLRCPNCGGTLSLRAPGASQAIACEYCGSELSLAEHGEVTEAILRAQAVDRLWKPLLELGSKGRLRGIDWEIIGAMRRAVRVDGVDYGWTEYLLYNPYRGFRWLVEANGHFNLVRLLADVPPGGGGNYTPDRLNYQGDTFKHFQSGQARVRRVLGEFTWQVHAGDAAGTADWVAPPRMLSRERTHNETTWSLGEYLPVAEVRAAFGPTPEPHGIAPNQPNPFADPAVTRRSHLFTGALVAIALAVWALAFVIADNDTLLAQRYTARAVDSTEVFVSEPFEVPDTARRNLKVSVESDLTRSLGQVHVALLNLDDSTAYLVSGSAGSANRNSAWLRRVNPGRYVARVEVAKNSTTALPPIDVQLRIVRNPLWSGPYWPLLLYAFAGLLVVRVGRAQFEARRWSESDHAY